MYINFQFILCTLPCFYATVYGESSASFNINRSFQDLRSLHQSLPKGLHPQNEIFQQLKIPFQLWAPERSTKTPKSEHLRILRVENFDWVLLRQSKYERGKIIRRGGEERESLLGLVHQKAVDDFHELEMKLYYEGKYGKIKKMFREIVKRRKKNSNSKHLNTFNSIYNLNITLLHQNKYQKIKKIF